jgi:hypothetical protein
MHVVQFEVIGFFQGNRVGNSFTVSEEPAGLVHIALAGLVVGPFDVSGVER